jgi:hypothetical protein
VEQPLLPADGVRSPEREAERWKNRPSPSTLLKVTALSEPRQLMETDVFAIIHDKREGPDAAAVWRATELAQRRTANSRGRRKRPGLLIWKSLLRRFLLRDFNEGDQPALLAYHADPRSLEFYGPDDADRGHAQRLLETFKRRPAERPRRNYQLAVIQRREPEPLVGSCGLRSSGCKAGEAELGIELAPE